MSDALLKFNGLTTMGDGIEIFHDRILIKGTIRRVENPVKDITEIKQKPAHRVCYGVSVNGYMEFYVNGKYQLKNILYYQFGHEKEIEQIVEAILHQKVVLLEEQIKKEKEFQKKEDLLMKDVSLSKNHEDFFDKSVEFTSGTAELEKWAELRDKGIISEEDFQKKKDRIMFHGDLPEMGPLVLERETIKEIVKIPCKYCGTMIENTCAKCPSCGGPVK